MFIPAEINMVFDGTQEIYHFENGYGASVISHKFSYGGERGLFEIAVLDQNDDLCYSTPVTDDVLGNLDRDEVKKVLDQINDLPPISVKS